MEDPIGPTDGSAGKTQEEVFDWESVAAAYPLRTPVGQLSTVGHEMVRAAMSSSTMTVLPAARPLG